MLSVIVLIIARLNATGVEGFDLKAVLEIGAPKPEAARSKFLNRAHHKIFAPPRTASGDKAKFCAILTHLLELLNRTLVDTTALVDQVCRIVSDTVITRARVGSRLRPVVVDFPESTWPITTTLI